MGNINKGTIASISGNTARVVPSDAGAKPTAKITIPWHLRGSTGNLSKGTVVVYVEFDDSTGLLLGRARWWFMWSLTTPPGYCWAGRTVNGGATCRASRPVISTYRRATSQLAA